MLIPENLNDYIKLVIAVGVLIAAIYLQATQNEIPEWLITAISGVIVYYFGLSSQAKKP